LAIIQALVGARYLLRGLKLIHRPGLRRYAYLPLILNTLLFAALIWLGATQFDAFINTFLPPWLEWLRWLLWPLFAVTIAIAVFFIFSLFVNLVSAPFNGLLAEAVEQHLSGEPISPLNPRQGLLREVLFALGMELRKLSYFLGRAVPLLLLSLIPGLNVAAPFLWMTFGAWMLALQYLDYPLGNHGISFSQQRQYLRRHYSLGLGFGSATLLANAIPLVNFLVIPSAVAGATALWVERLKPAETFSHSEGNCTFSSRSNFSH
jgi:CysZ protein